ncbi:expressed unknown protein [Seminavis robusta]|uniref:Uncharacterized protein n=1 Tax=Seminavis robusta TaxID=568900 RepID=A0A9N8EMY5_9STRA|nr:expressed unknown protein [Seminavis robusta]|eukprot:Sro1395_g269090.1 n/a (402) ;mRNA; f:22510-23715
MTSTLTTMNWEPLPPREKSSRQQRRRARGGRANADASHEGQPKKNVPVKGDTKPKRKPNRPGFNSYLKVLLDDATMDRLFDVATRIQKKVQDLQNQTDESDEENKSEAAAFETATSKEKVEPKIKEDPSAEEKQESKAAAGQSPGPEKKQRKKRPLSFKARSRASLHMTFFFGGENLCELPKEELQDWYDQVRDRLEMAEFVVQKEDHNNNAPGIKEGTTEEQSSETAEDLATMTTSTVTGDYWFDVTDVRIFPPGRNNLIVAHLEATPAWHVLHNDIRDIAKNSDSKGLNDIVAYSKEKWTAHITLGNIFGGGSKGQIRQAFSAILEELTEELMQEGLSSSSSAASEASVPEGTATNPQERKSLFKATTFGIGMGGPMPEQLTGIDLDWGFVYKPTKLGY